MRTWFQGLPKHLQAAIFATIAAITAAGFSVAVRLATDELHPLEVVFFRNLFGFLLILPFSLRGGLSSLKTNRLPMFGLRALFSTGAMSLWFSAIAYMPLAEATTLNFTVPLFGTILAAVILKEQIRHHRILALLAGFAGVAIIIRPGSETMQLASLLPIGAALCMASAGLTIKSLARTESSANVVMYTMLIMAPVTLIPALFVWQAPTWNVIGILVIGTALANVTQICNTNAFRLYDYSFVIGFNYLRLPFVVLIALVMFGEVPEIWLLPGATLIIGSALYIARREAKLAREAKRFHRRPTAAATDLDPPPTHTHAPATPAMGNSAMVEAQEEKRQTSNQADAQDKNSNDQADSDASQTTKPDDPKRP